MAQPQKVMQRQQIEQQLVLNRAKLQEIEEGLQTLTAERNAAEKQVWAAQAALEGYDLGYTAGQVAAAQAKQAETPPVENKEN